MQLGWHVLASDGTTYYGGLRPVPGETLYHKGALVRYHNGLHYCPHALDALVYAPAWSTLVERVEAVGKTVVPAPGTEPVYVTDARKCLWIVDAACTLDEFAEWCTSRASGCVRLDANAVVCYALFAARTRDARYMAWVRRLDRMLLAFAPTQAAAASADAVRMAVGRRTASEAAAAEEGWGGGN